jgi:hypothetical protein
LYDAVDGNNLDMVRLLVSKGANLDVKLPNRWGTSPLHAATVTRFTDMTKLLLELGASPKVTNDTQSTPLHLVLAMYDPPRQPSNTPTESGAFDPLEITKLLVKHGANINAQSTDGSTPLHTAVSGRMPPFEALEWLLANGADPKIKDASGKTPAMAAITPICLWLEARTNFPTMNKERAIHVMTRFGVGSPMTPLRTDPVAQFDTAPKVEHLVPRIPNFEYPAPAGPPSEFDLIVYRLAEDTRSNEVARVHLQTNTLSNALALSRLTNLPQLEWGDVVVLSERDPNTPEAAFLPTEPPAEYEAAVKRATRNVTIQVGDRERVFGLYLDLGVEQLWDPSSGRIPEFRLSQLVEWITGGEPRAQLEGVKVQRMVNGKQMEWTVDLRSDDPMKVKSMPARLANGDRVIIPLRSAGEPESLKNRRSGIFRTIADGVFGECVFRFHEKDNAPRTLGELIAESYRNSPMIAPDPDLSNIRIRRLKREDNSEAVLKIDFARIAGSVSAKTPEDEARRLDVPLEWGDIVEIGTLPKTATQANQWNGLSAQLKLFLTKSLTRNVTFLTIGGKGELFRFGPLFQEFEAFQSPLNYIWAKRLPEFPTKSDFRAWPTLSPFSGPNLLRVRLESRGTIREFTPEELRSVAPWVLDDDRFEIERF